MLCYLRLPKTIKISCKKYISTKTSLWYSATLILSVLSPPTHRNEAFQIVHEKKPTIDRPVDTNAPDNRRTFHKLANHKRTTIGLKESPAAQYSTLNSSVYGWQCDIQLNNIKTNNNRLEMINIINETL